MNIKKIIREEVSDLEWVEDINPDLFKLYEKEIKELMGKTVTQWWSDGNKSVTQVIDTVFDDFIKNR